MYQTKKRSRRKQKSNRKISLQMIEYLVSGGAFFWGGYLAFFIFDKELHWSLFYAKIIADVVGWIINYILQRYWVFNNPNLAKHQINVTERYLLITVVNFFIDYLIVVELKDVGISPYIGQFVSAGFFTVWNYLWYKYWVFPSKKVSRKIA